MTCRPRVPAGPSNTASSSSVAIQNREPDGAAAPPTPYPKQRRGTPAGT